MTTTTAETANYLMLTWRNDMAMGRSPLAYDRFDVAAASRDVGPVEGYCPHRVFEGATTWLPRFQCPFSTLTPGAGYPPHSDAHDVAIIVLEGEVETLGERAGPHNVVFYAAGEPHGMYNPGTATTRYLVFEFDGTPITLATTLRKRISGLLSRATKRQRWEQKLKPLLQRRG